MSLRSRLVYKVLLSIFVDTNCGDMTSCPYLSSLLPLTSPSRKRLIGVLYSCTELEPPWAVQRNLLIIGGPRQMVSNRSNPTYASREIENADSNAESIETNGCSLRYSICDEFRFTSCTVLICRLRDMIAAAASAVCC